MLRVGLKIVHINAQSFCNKIDEFRYIYAFSGMDIVCVSEICFFMDIIDLIYNLPSFRLYRSDRRIVINRLESKARGGGVAIFVRCDINCAMKMHSKAGSEVEYSFIVIIPKNKRKILVDCVYRPHRNVRIDLFISILESLSLEYNDIIILGDFNSNLLCNNTLIDTMRSNTYTLSWMNQQLDRPGICKQFVESYAI